MAGFICLTCSQTYTLRPSIDRKTTTVIVGAACSFHQTPQRAPTPTLNVHQTTAKPKRISNCKVCGEPIFFRFLELFERQNANEMLQWRRKLVRSWWAAYDVENPGLIHRHKLKLGESEVAVT